MVLIPFIVSTLLSGLEGDHTAFTSLLTMRAVGGIAQSLLPLLLLQLAYATPVSFSSFSYGLACIFHLGRIMPLSIGLLWWCCERAQGLLRPLPLQTVCSALSPLHQCSRMLSPPSIPAPSRRCLRRRRALSGGGTSTNPLLPVMLRTLSSAPCAFLRPPCLSHLLNLRQTRRGISHPPKHAVSQPHGSRAHPSRSNPHPSPPPRLFRAEERRVLPQCADRVLWEAWRLVWWAGAALDVFLPFAHWISVLVPLRGPVVVSFPPFPRRRAHD